MTITEMRSKCEHPLAGPRSLRCEDCGGIMRRCCQSILSFQHRAGCAEQTPEADVVSIATGREG